MRVRSKERAEEENTIYSSAVAAISPFPHSNTLPGFAGRLRV